MMKVDEKIRLTEEGWRRLHEELHALLQERRSKGKEHRTLMQDAEPDDAAPGPRGESASLERRISQLEAVLSQAEPVRRSARQPGVVDVGSSVSVRWEDDDAVETYIVCGPPEVHVAAGRISYASPVGRALMGRRVGDMVEVSTPGGLCRLHIVAVT